MKTGNFDHMMYRQMRTSKDPHSTDDAMWFPKQAYVTPGLLSALEVTRESQPSHKGKPRACIRWSKNIHPSQGEES